MNITSLYLIIAILNFALGITYWIQYRPLISIAWGISGIMQIIIAIHTKS